MSQQMHVRIPSPGAGLDPDALVHHANLYIDELQAAFDLDLDDERATLDECRVQKVTLAGCNVKISYWYSYSAYYGCKDMDYANDNDGEVTGRVEGDEWIFEAHVPEPPRSTFEEF
jgi:hypothetical protein